MYELSMAESVAELGPDLWQELVGPRDYPFLRFEWLKALEDSAVVGPEKGWVPRHLVVRRGKELVAVAPAYIKLHSFGEFVFDQGWAEFAEMRLGVRYYPKLVLAVPFTPATGPRVLFREGARSEDRAATFDLLTGALPEVAEKLGLSSVHMLFPDEETSGELEARNWALRLGVQFQFKNNDYGDFDDFLATFRSKRRASIRRERRHLEESEVQLEVRNGESLDRGLGRAAYELYLTTVDKHVWGRRYLNRGFFDYVLEKMPESLHLVLARDKAGDIVAGAFNLLGKHALYGRYWGAFEEVPFLHFNVCLYAGIEECIRRGLGRFEPGAGGGHKEGRGFSPTATRSLHYLHDRRLDEAVRDFCGREAQGVLKHIEERTSSSQ